MRLDLRLQVGNLLLGSSDGIGTGDEAPRGLFLVCNRDQRSRELRRIAGLPPVPRFPILDERSSTLVVVRVGRFGVDRRLLRKKLSAEKNPGLTMVVLMPKGATSACSDSVQPSRPNFDTRRRRKRSRSELPGPPRRDRDDVPRALLGITGNTASTPHRCFGQLLPPRPCRGQRP